MAHAFASALAPCDEYDQGKVEEALVRLGQKDLNRLSCVYCGRSAQTWDHLENLVKAGRLNGYGHLHEACAQLWREGDARQVPNEPEVALVSAGGGPIAGCMLLRRD